MGVWAWDAGLAARFGVLEHLYNSNDESCLADSRLAREKHMSRAECHCLSLCLPFLPSHACSMT